jgi:gas vesicle protein
MRRFFNFVAGAFCGALVGSVAALLLAPESGEQLRRRAAEQFESLQREMNDAYAARRAQLEAELEALRQRGTSQE